MQDMDCELGHEDIHLEDDGTLDTLASWECECGQSGIVRLGLGYVDREEDGDITEEGWREILDACQDDHDR